ncbi:RC-LH1 core complex protein PufX [Roseinatronobacter sp. S2]|uniref:RC-LH1 core complex protein PufX n=1 Tax=Roseinatronobacter sp. S2 TaxID=3035471 RepID=UPI00240FB78E|nr:RC-LH1 core complex protein PufX [Roseinatronobacter sp. S2]WFE76798.1 RC-LH1 core complex protein PufX [Roseinatronobacter sp. S2]
MAEHDYIRQTPSERIRNWILYEMLRGAGYAASVLVGIGVIIALIHIVSLFLPDESKNAPPPMPYSQMIAPPDTAISRV